MSRFAVLEHDEITMLRAAVDTLELSEVAGEALHLERGVGRRVWLVQSRTGQFTYEVPDHDRSKPYNGFPLYRPPKVLR